jgi:integrase
MPLSEIRAQDLGEFAAWVASRPNRRDPGRPLSANTVRLALVPVKLALATAHQEGLIRSNPAHGLRLAHAMARSQAGADDDPARKALTDDELRRLIAALAPEWRLFVRLLAETGLRISEAVGLRWKDIDFETGRIRVSRRIREGDVGEPKSDNGRRRIPLTRQTLKDLVELRQASDFAAPDDPVFATRRGTPLSPSNVASRVFKPAAREAGVGWAGFHTLRHTCASALFRRGASHKQVQVWLGHADPGFTLRTYVHLLPEDLPDPAILDDLTRPDDGG